MQRENTDKIKITINWSPDGQRPRGLRSVRQGKNDGSSIFNCE